MKPRQDHPVLPVPRSWSELTPEWMTAALARRCPGVVVADISIGEIEQGTNDRASIELRYAAGAGPARVFLKLHGRVLHRLALIALGALGAEAHLVEAQAVDRAVELPLEHPQFYAGAIDHRHLSTAVLMEDVTVRSGRPGRATTPLTVEEARSGLDGLAALHARYWDRPLPGALGFLRPWHMAEAWRPVSLASLVQGLHRLRRAGHEALVVPGVRASMLERQFRASATLASAGSQTVLHGDPHPGNTYALPGSRTGFYDWQLVRTGHWSHDVGYFLASSLDVADRRAHEEALLRDYLEALARRGVEAPSFEGAWSRYRATPAYGLGAWLHSFSFGSFQPETDCLTMLERFAAAYRDLETRTSPALASLISA